MQTLKNDLPLVPSGLFQKGIVFPRSHDEKVSHFHISTPHFIYTLKFPILETLNVVECKRESRIIGIKGFNGEFMIVVYSDLSVELRSLEDLGTVVRSWSGVSDERFASLLSNLKGYSSKSGALLSLSHVDIQIRNQHNLSLHAVGQLENSSHWVLLHSRLDLLQEAGNSIERLIENPLRKGESVNGIAVNDDASAVSIITDPLTHFLTFDSKKAVPTLLNASSVRNSCAATAIVYVSELDSFVVGFRDGTLTNFTNNGKASISHNHSGRIGDIALFENRYLATCSKDGLVMISDFKHVGQNAKKLNHHRALRFLTPTPNNEHIIIVSETNEIIVIEPNAYVRKQSGFFVSIYQGIVSPKNMRHYHMKALNQDKSSVTFVGGSSIQFFNLAKGEEGQFIDLHDQVPDINPFENSHVKINVAKLRTTAITFSKSDSLMASAEQMGGATNIKVWKNMQGLYTLQYFIDSPHEEEVGSLIFSTDNTCLISTGKDRSVKVWDLTGERVYCKKTISLQDKRPYASALSPDGSILAVAFASRIAFYDVQDYSLIRYSAVGDKKCLSIGFLSDSTILIQFEKYIQSISLSSLQSLWKFKMSGQNVRIAINPHKDNEFAMLTHEEGIDSSRLFLVDTEEDAPKTISRRVTGNAISLSFVSDLEIAVLTSDMTISRYLLSALDVDKISAGSTELVKGKLADVLAAPSEADKKSLKKSIQKLEKIGRDSSDDEMDDSEVSRTARSSVLRNEIDMPRDRFSYDPVRGKNLWKPLFEAPSHALPSSTDIFSAFVDGLLLRRDTQFRLESGEKADMSADSLSEKRPHRYGPGVSQDAALTISKSSQRVYIMRKGQPVLVQDPTEDETSLENQEISEKVNTQPAKAKETVESKSKPSKGKGSKNRK